MWNASRIIAVALASVILGLLAVGIVRGTLLRHVIQIVPAALALGLAVRRVSGAAYAALAVFAFWLLIMVAIWLFLLNLARITTGHFTPTEVALTFLIGASCLFGLSQTFRAEPAVRWFKRAAWAVAFAALQIGAMWASLRNY